MAFTRLKGPVYGAKSLLFNWSYAAGAVSSGASTHLMDVTATVILPIYQQCIVTELFCNVSTCSSVGNNILMKYESPSWAGASARGDAVSTTSGTVFSIASGTSTSINTFVAPNSPTAAEVEGFVLNPGSTLRLVSSGVNPLGVVQLNLHGYLRYVDSTRAV